jgi:pSer/pThr/pTyr-binding forkhead associated (FHA) protein
MIRGTRIYYPDFISYIKEVNIFQFLNKFRAPILIGVNIIDGDMTKATLHEYNQTFLFQENQEQEPTIDAKSIKRKMFLLRKIEDRLLKTENFSIGRDDKNDIIIVDYSISKKHAEIRYTEQGYILVDFRSRNGTGINGNTLIPNRAYPIHENDVLSFGRLSFVFLRPITIFISFRSVRKQEERLAGDARYLARKKPLVKLQRIAADHDVPYKELEKESLIQKILKNMDPTTLLYLLSD